MNNNLIIGTSGHSKVCTDALISNGYKAIGYIDDYKEQSEEFLDSPILGKTDDISKISNQYQDLNLFIAIGCNFIRNKIFEKLNQVNENYNFVSIVHNTAYVAKDVKIGNGVFIGPMAVVNPGSTIEDFAIINTKASVDHDCHIGKFSSVNPGVTTGGNVTLGDFSVLGIQSSVKHGIKIGSNTVIGSNAYVHNDILDNTVAVGTPAKPIREREFGESYL